jgi:predicted MFS family arabinose efflux permease
MVLFLTPLFLASSLGRLWRQFELRLTGPLPLHVRQNMRIELGGAMAFGAFHAALVAYIPVVLQNLGATPEMQSFYLVQTYFGLILTSFSVLLMRRRRTIRFAVLCWLLARSVFFLAFFVTQAGWLLAITGFFWLLETFPSPAYARIAQKIYPARHRGQVMAVVRIGMAAMMILVTPLAGWLLDHIGYRFLFPAATLLGLLATLRFSQLKVDEGPLPPRQTKSLRAMWQIVGQDRRFTFFLAAFVVYGLGALLGLALYPAVQVDRLQLSYGQIGLLGLTQSVCWLLGYIYWGKQVDRRGSLWVLRANFALYALVPFSYFWATNGWLLLPAFIAQGLVSAGVDLGALNATIQLAPPERVEEYSAVQSTIIGIRGLLTPLLGLLLLRLGLTDLAIFAIGGTLILVSSAMLTWLLGGIRNEKLEIRKRESP